MFINYYFIKISILFKTLLKCTVSNTLSDILYLLIKLNLLYMHMNNYMYMIKKKIIVIRLMKKNKDYKIFFNKLVKQELVLINLYLSLFGWICLQSSTRTLPMN
jgi:hypothetical protein